MRDHAWREPKGDASMVRHSLILVACALLLAGCDRPVNNSRGLADLRSEVAPTNAPSPSSGAAAPVQQQFSYTHSWSLIMGHGTVAPRFERARDLCLRDAALSCKLVNANITNQDTVSATLEVQLPHARLDGFEQALLAPLKGEAAGDAVMQSRSTQAQSVETEAGDTARKVAQLTAYRDRLADIGKRPNLGIDDIIKLEAERARVQDDLDAATGQQRQLTDGIAREDVSITLNERTEQESATARFADNASDTLADSAMSALLFTIAALPWLPLIVLAVWLVSLLWRWFQRRRDRRAALRRNDVSAAPPG
jgi:Domain of unknown function (DUF4349)